MLKVSKTSSDNSAAHLDRWASLVATDSMSLLSPWDLKLKAQHTKMLMFDKTTIPIQFSRCWRNNSGPGQILLFLPKDDPVLVPILYLRNSISWQLLAHTRQHFSQKTDVCVTITIGQPDHFKSAKQPCHKWSDYAPPQRASHADVQNERSTHVFYLAHQLFNRIWCPHVEHFLLNMMSPRLPLLQYLWST